VGKVWQVRKDLLEKGWLSLATEDGKAVYRVAIPGVEEFQEVKSIDVDFQEVKLDFQDMKQNFHVVSALPLIGQNEDHTIKANGSPAVFDDEQAAKQRAWEATVSLIEFWEELTGRKHPAQETTEFRDSWLKSFNAIWITCGRDVEEAKAKVAAVRDNMLGRGITIFDPAKLPAHVKAIVDQELLAMTERFSGNGRAANNGEALSLWQRTLQAINTGWIEDDRLRNAVKAIGGSSAIKTANEFNTPKLQERLFNEYRLSAA
jgi:hypothetical protein